MDLYRISVISIVNHIRRLLTEVISAIYVTLSNMVLTHVNYRYAFDLLAIHTYALLDNPRHMQLVGVLNLLSVSVLITAKS